MQIKSEIEAGHFKPNCALVIVNFMIRHGIITPDSGRLHGCWCFSLLFTGVLRVKLYNYYTTRMKALMLCTGDEGSSLYIRKYVFASTTLLQWYKPLIKKLLVML